MRYVLIVTVIIGVLFWVAVSTKPVEHGTAFVKSFSIADPPLNLEVRDLASTEKSIFIEDDFDLVQPELKVITNTGSQLETYNPQQAGKNE